MYFSKHKLGVILYRDNKSFRNKIFRADLDTDISKYGICNMQCQQFLNIFTKVLRKVHKPIKNKYIKKNQGGFINRNLRKAIMRRSRLCNFFSSKSP